MITGTQPSIVEGAATCGITVTPGWRQNACSAGSGSGSKTSR